MEKQEVKERSEITIAKVKSQFAKLGLCSARYKVKKG